MRNFNIFQRKPNEKFYQTAPDFQMQHHKNKIRIILFFIPKDLSFQIFFSHELLDYKAVIPKTIRNIS